MRLPSLSVRDHGTAEEWIARRGIESSTRAQPMSAFMSFRGAMPASLPSNGDMDRFNSATNDDQSIMDANKNGLERNLRLPACYVAFASPPMRRYLRLSPLRIST